ncbi:cation:proton antiporter [Pararcticibacter amylolyticus]|uniref:Sodium:proton antiporter n=1 Tax=Pararcticibacter amylolyticus TaxID=2173175 RepID=A0A2U2PHJ1_9SPHI|nr:cation:proton antiporter [Pararcticibacter amylolyticus]PWG80875.1 sodium:proton antiporter [Pararcticibacter amylolyticus]
MIHLPQLITDLGLIMAAAAITTLIFKLIKQPLVLGYIIAGFLVGPHFKFIPTVAEEESISTWAEIGVIFLLFSLGLEFSFKKLAKVGAAASVTGVTEAVIMLLIGYLTGQLMGWTLMDSIFLGGILSISSTTIIIRAFDELKIKHKKFAGLVFGVLIVEDLVAILLLVVLSTVAVSRNFEGSEMIFSILKFGFFLILWFLGGIFLIPTFLKRTQKLMNEETLLIVSLALCLLMVILAVKVGFSPALGAFIMGSILAETTLAKRIEHLTKSVKDLFAAVFFVSVGMLINPSILKDFAVPIVIITAVTVAGKLISTITGAILSGQPIKTAVQAGMSLAQIGEFSFIIATLGLDLKVTNEFLYPIAVAVSAITTFTTPYLIKLSEPFSSYLEKKLPEKWVKSLNDYSTNAQNITTTSNWKKLLRAYLLNAVIHSVILIAILYASSRFIHPFVTANISNGTKGSVISLSVSFILMAPFLWAFALRRIEKKAYANLWLNKRYNRGPIITIEAVRIILAIIYIGFLINIFFNAVLAITIALVTIVIMIAILSKKLQAFYSRIENRFLENLNDRESQNSDLNTLVPWDTHLSELVVAPESPLIGQTLQELAVRERYGVNIALIERGKLVIATPGRDERLFPNDKLTVIGSDDQLEALKRQIEVSELVNPVIQGTKKDMKLLRVDLSSTSPVCNLSIRDSGIREKTQGLIVGIESNNQRILNPESSYVLKAGDIVWIVGNPKKISELLKG